jgi:hypothetical protein
MNSIYKKTLLFASLTLITVVSINSASGPAFMYSAQATGAPFDNGTCTQCHGGSTNWTAALTLQVLSGTTVVSGSSPVVTGNYVPGWTYTVRITRSASATLPANGGWGFQITSATSPGNVNVNGWGTPPANTHNTLLNSHNYIEHGVKLPKTQTTIDIPWTAPAAGTGTVKFYVALNTVNGDGGSGNDQVLSTSLTMNQAPLPITWLYFRGKEYGGSNILEWATTNEMDNKFFTLEKSEDGTNFYELAKVNPQQDPAAVHTYSYTDNSPLPKTFYRIKQTDISGNESYFRTIQITKEGFVKASHSIVGNDILISIESDRKKTADVALYTLNGQKLAMESFSLSNGVSSISLPKPQAPGLYFLSIMENNSLIYKGKVLVSF